MNFWIIFLTGLTTGGLSCLAVQGGLLTSIIANQKDSEIDEADVSKKELKTRKRKKYLATQQSVHKTNLLPGSFDQLDWMPVVLFLLTKLVAHIILGFFLGWLGSKLQLSLTVRLIFQGLAALFMFGTAMNLLEVHPIFRYLVFQPPRFIQRWLRNTSKGKAFFTPAVLGLMTIFIPCGVTQSMEVLAMSSGNAFVGALILGVFVLGTSPLFAVIGIATAKLSETFQTKFLRVAAGALILLSVSSFNGILVVLNSPITIGSITHPITYFFSDERYNTLKNTRNSSIGTVNGIQVVNILASSNGYTPNKITVKAGIPVQLTVQTKDTFSCASSFVFKEFNISFQLGPTDSKVAMFTPNKPGKYQFTCGMGMYKGELEVI
ncbi:MAG: sulfite exporter TauE/SafE family protein [Patescibacteria group bacterium]